MVDDKKLDRFFRRYVGTAKYLKTAQSSPIELSEESEEEEQLTQKEKPRTSAEAEKETPRTSEKKTQEKRKERSKTAEKSSTEKEKEKSKTSEKTPKHSLSSGSSKGVPPKKSKSYET